MTEYPKLMWSPDNVEITVQSKTEEAEKEAQGYVCVRGDTPHHSTAAAAAKRRSRTKPDEYIDK